MQNSKLVVSHHIRRHQAFSHRFDKQMRHRNADGPSCNKAHATPIASALSFYFSHTVPQLHALFTDRQMRKTNE
jgi:hypothetical protein